MAQSLVQSNAPLDKRGRVIGMFNMSSLGLRAFSGVSVGLIGVHWSLALSALATLAVAACLLALPRRTILVAAAVVDAPGGI